MNKINYKLIKNHKTQYFVQRSKLKNMRSKFSSETCSKYHFMNSQTSYWSSKISRISNWRLSWVQLVIFRRFPSTPAHQSTDLMIGADWHKPARRTLCSESIGQIFRAANIFWWFFNLQQLIFLNFFIKKNTNPVKSAFTEVKQIMLINKMITKKILECIMF